ncbi:BlaI/MecI/CopY family transcriptional regulator [Candidatus Clostridium stratigraminis]|uniref:BlaI/MecI/CopY family transcriptional regulator n=1 Tax=Candidatus Clostridium stratigraminis TaxID=3381661 RepID=A0ABW8T3D9_9CLOT
MPETPRISDAEWEVMKIIWSNPNITANKIVENLEDNAEWKPSTIKSLINRLLKKQAIGFKKVGKEYFYYTLVLEEDCIKAESESFVKKVFDGSINSMILNFVKSNKLSENDIAELRQILDKSQE